MSNRKGTTSRPNSEPVVVHLMTSASPFHELTANLMLTRVQGYDHRFISSSSWTESGHEVHDRTVLLPPSSHPSKRVLSLLRALAGFEPSPAVLVLHGAFDSATLMALALRRSLLSRTLWIIWGGDLAALGNERSGLKAIPDKIRRSSLKHVGALGYLAPADASRANIILNTHLPSYPAVYRNVLVSDTLDVAASRSIRDQHGGPVRLLLGNSATASNRHLEMLEILAQKDGDFEVVVPLTYGDQAYAARLCQQGNALLGERFVPLLDHQEPQEFADLLASVDGAIFNQTRQQALGTILALAYLGKRIWAVEDGAMWSHLKDGVGLPVRSTEELSRLPVDALGQAGIAEIRQMKSAARAALDEDRVGEVWRTLLQDFLGSLTPPITAPSDSRSPS